MIKAWFRKWLLETLIATFGMLAVIAFCVFLNSFSKSTLPYRQDPPAVTFVAGVDALCEHMADVERALCVIAVTLPAYGQEQADGTLTFTPNGRTLVRECVETSTDEEVRYCLLEVAVLPDDHIPMCPGDLASTVGPCVYINGADTPTVWRADR